MRDHHTITIPHFSSFRVKPPQVEGKNLTRVFVQDTVLDFPRLNVITRDNASVYIDSVLSFKVVNPKLMLCVPPPIIPLTYARVIRIDMMWSIQIQLREPAGYAEQAAPSAFVWKSRVPD